MAYFYIIWMALCYSCSLAIEATYKGWLFEKGENTVKFVQKFCKWFILVSLLVCVALTIIIKNL